MSQLNALLSDLRDKKLWPLAIVLLAAVVAVPVLLSSTSTPPPAQPLPSLATPVSATANVPAVTVDATPGQAAVAGAAHDPFVQQPLPALKSTAGAAAAAVASAAGAAVSSASGSSSSGTTGASTSGSSTSTPSTPVTPVPPVNTKPKKPAPSGLTSDEAYHVSVEITDPSGGVNPIDPLVRDTELPSTSQPLLVEIGVLQGGKRVLFAVQPGAVVGGPGTCIPGSVDCEVLSLSVGQTESVRPAGSGASTLFQVTDISADRFASAAQASKARATVNSAGRDLLASSTSSTLALFQYVPALGAVVDQRNLTVGGN
jgi:hypothetical protein